MIGVLNRRLEQSPLKSVHGLAKVVPTISRSQLYLLMRGQAVIDVAELFAICDALEITAREVITEAEYEVAARRRAASPEAVAAYDDGRSIEDEQGPSDVP